MRRNPGRYGSSSFPPRCQHENCREKGRQVITARMKAAACGNHTAQDRINSHSSIMLRDMPPAVEADAKTTGVESSEDVDPDATGTGLKTGVSMLVTNGTNAQQDHGKLSLDPMRIYLDNCSTFTQIVNPDLLIRTSIRLIPTSTDIVMQVPVLQTGRECMEKLSVG